MTDASLHTFHVCHAVVFPLPLKDDTSQPVKAWKKSIPLVFSGPMADTGSWIAIHLLCSPLPNATHIFSRPVAAREGIRNMAMTTMSVSLASITRDVYPSMAACRACTNIRVSASSWEHGATSSRLPLVSVVVMMAFTPLVMITGLPVVISATLSAKKWNSSVLLVLSIRKLCQLKTYLNGTYHQERSTKVVLRKIVYALDMVMVDDKT